LHIRLQSVTSPGAPDFFSDEFVTLLLLNSSTDCSSQASILLHPKQSFLSGNGCQVNCHFCWKSLKV